MNEKIIRHIIRDLATFHLIIVVKDPGDHIHLFKRCKITVELKPYISADLFKFLEGGVLIKIGIMIFADKKATLQKIIGAVLPSNKIF